MIAIIGANSALAECIAIDLVENGCNQILLVARNKEKLDLLRGRLREINVNVLIITYIADLSKNIEIDNCINFLKSYKNSLSKIILCAGLMYEDHKVRGSRESIEIFYVNAILPIKFLESKISEFISSKIVIISSIFSIFEKRNKTLYSISKRFFYKLFISQSIEDSILILMGPIYSPMYNGAKRIYVRPPSEISKVILKIADKESHGAFVVPKFWKYSFLFLPLLKWV